MHAERTAGIMDDGQDQELTDEFDDLESQPALDPAETGADVDADTSDALRLSTVVCTRPAR
jgi:hypothetical protein